MFDELNEIFVVKIDVLESKNASPESTQCAKVNPSDEKDNQWDTQCNGILLP